MIDNFAFSKLNLKAIRFEALHEVVFSIERVSIITFNRVFLVVVLRGQVDATYKW